jgi:hypothetical protein
VPCRVGTGPLLRKVDDLAKSAQGSVLAVPPCAEYAPQKGWDAGVFRELSHAGEALDVTRIKEA